MLILGVDTSGKQGSIALSHCPAPAACEAIEVVPLEGGTFSAQLVPQIASLLEKHGFSKSELGGFAVVSGPGSFTGLRVGLAAVKALAEILGKPIAAVSLLEAVALAGGRQGRVLSALDAGRNEIYAGEYETASEAQCIGEQLLTKEEFQSKARGLVVISPDRMLLDLASSVGGTAIEVPRPRSDSIAQLGWHRIQHGQTVPPEELEANYIRRSDAEIFSKRGYVRDRWILASG